jgi:hypothetical protein
MIFRRANRVNIRRGTKQSRLFKSRKATPNNLASNFDLLIPDSAFDDAEANSKIEVPGFVHSEGQGFTPIASEIAKSFLDLTDTPDTYSSQTLKLTRVNAGETAIEFVAPASLGLGTIVPVTTAGPAVTISTSVQTIGYITIVPLDGTITYMAVYVSQWTPDISTDEITVRLVVNGVDKDTFLNSSGTVGVKSGTISEAVAQGDYIAIGVVVSTQNAGLDVIKVTSASCNLTAVVL